MSKGGRTESGETELRKLVRDLTNQVLQNNSLLRDVQATLKRLESEGKKNLIVVKAQLEEFEREQRATRGAVNQLSVKVDGLAGKVDRAALVVADAHKQVTNLHAKMVEGNDRLGARLGARLYELEKERNARGGASKSPTLRPGRGRRDSDP